jgi:hypothetical protein
MARRKRSFPLMLSVKRPQRVKRYALRRLRKPRYDDSVEFAILWVIGFAGLFVLTCALRGQ